MTWDQTKGSCHSIVPALLLAAIVLVEIPAQATAPPGTNTEALETGRKLCAALDFNRPDLRQVKTLADEGDYPSALTAWRDLVVQSLRRSNQGEFPWSDVQISAPRLGFAEELARGIPDGSRVSGHVITFNDYFDMAGPPGRGRAINWLAKDQQGGYPPDYQSLSCTIPLAANYWKTGDPIYLQKWFEIVSDFARNQKREAEGLAPAELAKLPCNWSQGAQATLSEGDRLCTIIRGLAILCKSLPDGEKPNAWTDISPPVAAPLTAKSLELIPPVELAQIVLSLVRDYPPGLMERYLMPGAVPNQRCNGLSSLLLLCSEFPCFTALQDVQHKTAGAFQEYLATSVQADGGMLEQSFNYNLNDALVLENLALQIQQPFPDLARSIGDKMAAFRRAMASLTTPFGGLPVVGNLHPETPPAFWGDPLQIAAWQSKLASPAHSRNNPIFCQDPLVVQVRGITSARPGATAPAFTSIALPYSGYYVQRRDWSLASPYLFLAAGPPSRGHGFHGVNNIQIAAYGRDLLVAGGPPPYTPSFLAPADRPDFDKIIEFLGEASSWKANTVIIDGKSQAGSAPVAMAARTNPLPNLWSSSASLDLAEGTYDLGYGTGGKDGAGHIAVQHRREVIFVRNPGFWIVTDRLISEGPEAHTCTQLWNFPPHAAEGGAPVNGFEESEVVCDNSLPGIHTSATAGPNLWLYHYGQPSLQYAKFYGQRTPVYRGWFARTFGSLIPSVHVEASWKSTGNSLLITVLWPVASGMAPPVPAEAWHRLGAQAATGFSVTLSDGSTLTYLASTNPANMRAGPIDATAQALAVLNSPRGPGAGIILGAEKIRVGRRAIPLPAPNFQFTLDGPNLETPLLIEPPKTFHWVSTGGGIEPSYGED